MTSFICVLVVLVCCHVGVAAEEGFNYLNCVKYNTASDNATAACESVIRGGKQMDGAMLDNLALYICIRTVPCAMHVVLDSIPECAHLGQDSTPDQDLDCRSAFLGDEVTVHAFDRSNKLTNCEQNVETQCAKFSPLSNSIKLDLVTKDVAKLSSKVNLVQQDVKYANGNITGLALNITNLTQTTIKMPEHPQWLIGYGIYSVGCTFATTQSLNPTWFIIYVMTVVTDAWALWRLLLWIIPGLALVAKFGVFYYQSQTAVSAAQLVALLSRTTTSSGCNCRDPSSVVDGLERAMHDDDSRKRVVAVVDVSAEIASTNDEGQQNFMAHVVDSLDQLSSAAGTELGTRKANPVKRYLTRSTASN